MKKLIVALLTLLAISAFAVVETWEFEAVADTYVVYHHIDYVVQDITYENFGGEDELKLYRWQDFGNPHYELFLESVLLDFDLSTLDDSVEYTSLSLSMFLTDTVASWMDMIELTTITEPWDEYTVTGADSPAHTYPPTFGIYGSSWVESDIGSYVSADLDPAHISHLLDDASYGIYLEHAPPELYYWYFASRETSNPPKLIVEYDDEASIAPFVAEQNPPDGATGVPLSYYSFSFHVYDEHSGVDTATIDFTVTSSDSKQLSTANETLLVSSTIGNISQRDGKGVITGTLNIDDSDLKDVICNFVLDENLPSDSTITCTVAAGLADNAGNATDTDIVWSFTTAGDSTIEETTWGQIKASY